MRGNQQPALQTAANENTWPGGCMADRLPEMGVYTAGLLWKWGLLQMAKLTHANCICVFQPQHFWRWVGWFCCGAVLCVVGSPCSIPALSSLDASTEPPKMASDMAMCPLWDKNHPFKNHWIKLIKHDVPCILYHSLKSSFSLKLVTIFLNFLP